MYRKTRDIPAIVGPSIAYVPLTQGLFALIDADSLLFVSGFNWFAAKEKSGVSYAGTQIPNGLGKQRRRWLHRYLMGDPTGLYVDHRNGNTLDNRMCNLRLATASDNNRNRRPRYPHQKKGAQKTPSGRWVSQIWDGTKNRYLGTFATEDEANNAYKLAAIEQYGEFARYE